MANSDAMAAAKVLEQQFETVPTDQLKLHDRNANNGDVGAIYGSITTNGFWGALIVQKSTGTVLVGNHRLVAARDAGITELPVLWVDVDDEQALRMLVADNRTARLGYDNIDVLSEILVELAMSESGLGLQGTAYDSDDLDAMLADLQRDEQPQSEPRQAKPVLVIEAIDSDQAAKLATDLVELHRPLTKVTIHCASAAERDLLRDALVEKGYKVMTQGGSE